MLFSTVDLLLLKCLRAGRKLCVVLSLLFLTAPFYTIIANGSQYRFDSWTTDNGLPQASVNSITQTRDGFLWFSTFGGLVRYDGLRFQVFNTGNTEGLKSGRFNQLFEDRNGGLWINTEGRGTTLYKNGEFKTFTTEDGLPGNQIDPISIDDDGNLVFTAVGRSARLIDGTFQPFVPPNDEAAGPNARRMQFLQSWYYDGSHLSKFEKGIKVADVETTLPLRRLFEDSQHRVWLATVDNRLFVMKDGVISSFTEKEGYNGGTFFLAHEGPDNSLWFAWHGGKSGDGLAIFKDGKFTYLNNEDGLVNNAVRFIYHDREGNVWVGTAGGLSRMTRQVITSYSMDDGLAANNIYPIIETRDGRIWIGSWTGLSIYENGKFQNVSAQYGLQNAEVTSLYEDTDGSIWVGTWGGEPRHLKDGKIVDVPGSQIRAIIRDRSGNMWFGTSEGLTRFKDEVITTYTPKDGLSDLVISSIFEDSAGRLWIGTNSGVTKYENGVFTGLSEKDGIERNIVRSFYEDSDGVLWIGMYDSGLYRYADGKFTHYTIKNGLFDNGVFRIIEDDTGNFWISSNIGIYRVKKAELNEFAAGLTSRVSSIPYNRRDGMLNSECNGGGQPAGMKARDGRIWFPTQKGVAIINPEAVPFNPQPPPVVIEAINIDSDPVQVKPKINVEPDQTNLELHYSGLSFINPELVKFKYKLDGLDNDWIDAGTRRTAYYPHLPPGEYTFTVLAANRDGVWSPEGAKIVISVLPPFWQTRWFLALITLAVMMLVYFAYRYRIGQLKKANAAQEAFARQLIESQEKERKRIAAELHDSLGQSLVLIKNWALLGLGGMSVKDPAKPNLEEISTTASEAIKEVREIAYNLGPYQLERLGLRNTIIEMVQKVSDSSPIKFESEIGEIDNCLERDSEVSLFRVLQEVINNVVKHSEATEAFLHITKEKDLITLLVRDNGKGFDPVYLKHGFGLLGMTERIGFLRGDLQIRSEIGKGTSIKVTLPCKDLSK